MLAAMSPGVAIASVALVALSAFPARGFAQALPSSSAMPSCSGAPPASATPSPSATPPTSAPAGAPAASPPAASSAQPSSPPSNSNSGQVSSGAAAPTNAGNPASETQREEQRATESAPREHFSLALTYYRAGQYRRAIGELERALALDPTSKDLHYNLAVVHEKLGELPEAIRAFERYRELERDPAELARTDQALVRLRGARGERFAAASPNVPRESGPRRAISASGARLPLLGAAAISVTAALTGVVFGVRALALRPDSDPETRPGRGLEELRRDQRDAETAAKVADVSFAISLAAGAVASAIWFSDKSCRCSVAVAGPMSVALRRNF